MPSVARRAASKRSTSQDICPNYVARVEMPEESGGMELPQRYEPQGLQTFSRQDLSQVQSGEILRRRAPSNQQFMEDPDGAGLQDETWRDARLARPILQSKGCRSPL